MTVRACLGPACIVLATAASSPACAAEAAPSRRRPAESEEAEAGRVTPTIEWVRDVIVKRGVPARFVRIERPEEGPAPSPGRLPRLVFWTRTRRITQTVVVATTGEGDARYVRIQSAGLGHAPADHPRLAGVMSHLLDRNFVMTGAAFARDAADGEIVLRTELPAGNGPTEDGFTRALEALLRLADEEAPRLEAVLRTPGKEDGTGPE